MSTRFDRRRFLKSGGAAALGIGLSGSAAARPGARRAALGANERIRVGIIGCGGRGNYLLDQVARSKEAQNVTVSALCDVWRPARDRTAARVKAVFGSDPALAARFPDLLQRDDVDAVIIATPDHAHAPILAAAARHRKDAYCEKPMARTIEQANDALDAVRQNGAVVQIGTQRRSDGRFAAAARLIQDGLVGRIVAIDTAWHDHNPRWDRSFNDVKREDLDWEAYLMDLPARDFDARRYRCWHLYHDYTVGPIGLLGSHLIDVATWFAGDPYPRAATAHGGVFAWKEREQADTIEALYDYPSGFQLSYATRLANSKATAEVIVYGTNGTFDTQSFTAVPDGGGRERIAAPVEVPQQPASDHVADWLLAVRERRDPSAPIETGHAHSVASILAYEAWVRKRTLAWDPAARRIVDA